MEKDIKILEELIEFLKRNDVEDLFSDFTPEILAIENLINRNKELEEDYTSVYLKGVYDERDKWKSKVKEKIKELEQIRSTALTGRTMEMMDDKINILELILEEKE